jgi:rubrerythrin
VRVAPTTFDRLLKPLHRWVWTDTHRRARKLLTFAETEASGGRDLSRAAEITRDPSLRRLFLRHAQDEQRHADLFRSRGRELLSASPGRSRFEARWLAPGERGLDDLRVEGETDESLLAFLHLSEKAAAGRFALYGQVLDGDVATRAVFARVLEDEAFHMSYTRQQLARLTPRKQGLRLWQARAGRLWKAYLRVARALASVLGRLMLGAQYFILLPPFALLAKRAARREDPGFRAARAPSPLRRQY